MTQPLLPKTLAAVVSTTAAALALSALPAQAQDTKVALGLDRFRAADAG